MRRIINIFMAFILSFTLLACTSNNDNTSEPKEETQEVETKQETTQETKSFSEKEMINLISKEIKLSKYSKLYLDFDNDGNKELFLTTKKDNTLYTYYCSKDGKVEQVCQSEALDEYELKNITVNDEIHIIINSINNLGDNATFTAIHLENNKPIIILKDINGTINQDSNNNIVLTVQDYDAYYDASMETLIGHTYKETYLTYKDGKYSEIEAKEISLKDIKNYQDSSKYLTKITKEHDSNTEYKYYQRDNGILHVGCSTRDEEGSITYSYYTLITKDNKIISISEENSGIMKNTLATL